MYRNIKVNLGKLKKLGEKNVSKSEVNNRRNKK